MTDSLTLSAIGIPAEAHSSNKGFWDDEPEPGTPEHGKYLSLKLFLIVSELVEAFEELRKHKSPGDRYYSYPPVPPSLAAEFPSGGDAQEYWESKNTGKPEGFLSEMADVVIRLTELLQHIGLLQELEAAIIEKMEYNGTRPAMHGKAF